MVLYRKYRSKNFQEIYGQDPIIRVLKQAVSDAKQSHAYLFAGPRGTGKTSVARILAKAVNCLEPKNGEPCNHCKNCQAINEGRFLDLIEIDAASNRGIDEIRDLKEKVGFLPVEGKFKVYIIDEVHMLTNEAFNALLKTLEEPPARVIFVLATTEAHKVPLTIISRSQRFDFRLAKSQDLKQKLQYILQQEKVKMEEGALDLVIENAAGSFRDAETFLEKIISSFVMSEKLVIKKDDVEQILGLASSELVEKFLAAILIKNRAEAFLIVDEVQQGGINLAQFLKQLLENARKLMISLLEAHPQDKKIRSLVSIIKEFSQASYEQKFSLVATLPLEVAIIKLTDDPNFADTVVDVKAAVAPKIFSPTKSTVAKQTPNTVETKAVENNEETAKNYTLEQILGKWPQLLHEAKNYNHHLVAILTSSKPVAFADKVLTIEVPFVFHKKRVDDQDTQKIIKQMTKAVYGQSISIKSLINKQMPRKSSDEEPLSNEKIVEEIFNEEETP